MPRLCSGICCRRVAFVFAVAFWVAFAAPADAAPTARFVAAPIQGATCVAPCAVHFDAIGNGSDQTVDPAFPRAFHTLVFDWEFGDPSSGTWPLSGMPRNRAQGPLAGHTYTQPGTYTVRMCAQNPSGESSCATRTVTVANPDTTFAGNTVCISRSGNFTGCPTGAARVTRSDGVWNAALTDNAGCNADGRKARCLFRRGETWTANGSVSLHQGGGEAGLIGTFGTGARPLITRGAGTWIAPQGGWTVSGFEVVGAPGGSEFVSIGTNRRNITLHDLVMREVGHGCVAFIGPAAGSEHGDRNALIDVSCTHASGAPMAGLYIGSDRMLVMGVDIDSNYAGEFNFRTWNFGRSLIQHSRFRRPHALNTGASQRNNIQIRALAHSQGVGASLPRKSTEYVVISDNVLSMDNGAANGSIRFCQTNDCRSDAGGVAQEVGHVLIERNFFSYSTGSGGPRGLHSQGMVWAQGHDYTIRNNVLDLQGIETSNSGAGPIIPFCYHPPNNTAGGATLGANDVHCVGNTAYLDDATSRAITMCSSSVGSGHQCRANLVYAPSQTGTRSETSGNGWTAGGNLFATANPFVGTPGQQGASLATQFRLASSSAARDRYDFGTTTSVTLPTDFAALCRPAGTNGRWDAGAWESNADSACLRTQTSTGPVCGNGMVENGEACDDGNTVAGDGCSATCTVETPVCGNGRLEGSEACDDGNTRSGDGCSATCTVETPVCGNGRLEGSEACDDGNTRAGDGCSATCAIEPPVCGNGRLEGSEACDDGNAISGDGCRTNCTVERCGDGVLDGGEACDDGNTSAGDGCSAMCEIEGEQALEYLIDVARDGIYVDTSGRTWVGDAPFVNGGTTATSTIGVSFTNDDPLYQTRRFGPGVGQPDPLTYEFPVTGSGPYRVRLHFAEFNTTVGVGSRVFDVVFEDHLVLEDVDIFAAVGFARAYVRDYYVNVDDGLLTIRFEPQVGAPMISAIEVREQSSPAPKPEFIAP